MKKFTFLGNLKYVLILFQMITIIGAIVGVIILSTWNDKTAKIELNLNGISFKPTSEISSDNHEEISIISHQNTALKPKLYVTEMELEMSRADFKALFPYGNFFFIFILILVASIIVFGLEQIRRMIKSVERGSPFIRSNVWRVYSLSTLLFCIPLAQKLSVWIFYHWIHGHFDFSGITIRFNSTYQPVWFVSATLLFTIGKIMERGIEMKEEQDLTI